MLMVSSSRTAEKSVVARSLPDSTSGRQHGSWDVADVGVAGVDAADLIFAEIDSGDGEAGLGELDGQRQADVSQADDAHARAGASGSFLPEWWRLRAVFRSSTDYSRMPGRK